jgi:hypothetical protein
MALDSAGLEDDLKELAETPGETIADCAQQWADALDGYATGIIPTSTQVTTAAAALQVALAAAFANVNAAATAAAMEAAFLTFATTVGAGMAPAFVATPPPSPLGFATLFAAEPKPETHADAASDFRSAIDDWMITGTATPSVGGSPVNWS